MRIVVKVTSWSFYFMPFMLQDSLSDAKQEIEFLTQFKKGYDDMYYGTSNKGSLPELWNFRNTLFLLLNDCL